VTEPILSQRLVDQVIRLREGEASILGGIQNKQDQVSWSGIPGLSSIPILKYIFGSKDHTITDDELVFVVVPHIVRSQVLDAVNLRSIDTGTGQQTVEIRRVPGEGPGAKAAPAIAPAHPSANARPDLGTVPGQSAEAAAPAALAQLHQAAEANVPAAAPPATPKPAPAGPVSFALVAQPGPVATGVTFQVPVTVIGGADIASIPLQIQYDPAKLSLVNVDNGDFLGRDGQAVALVHRDDGPGSININASRPPGTPGMSGAGVVCVLSFQAKGAGETVVSITRPGAITSTQQQVPAQGTQVSIQVQ
jgi:general secretion pathway protein D